MKKSFLTIIAAVAMTLSANAQTSIIPKVGISIANVASDPKNDDAKSKIGLQLGVAAEIGITDMFAVQPELLFIQKGTKSESSDFGISAKSSTTLSYLEIPVLAKVKFGSDAAKFYAIAGPSIGIAVSGKNKVEAFGVSDSEDIEFGSEAGQIKRTDFGLQFGAGVNIKNFVIDVRYGLGLSNLSNDSSVSAKNRAIGITVGYAFPLGGK